MIRRTGASAALALGVLAVAAGPALALPPANDNFRSAIELSGDRVTVPGQTNVEATGQPGEPNHADASLRFDCTNATTPDSGCLPSVWYVWTASRTFNVTIDTCDPAPDITLSEDTTLAVYTGGAVNALSLVASNDQAGIRPTDGSCNPDASRVTFRAVAGTTYRIAVAGFGGAAVTFALNLFQTRPPGNDNFIAATGLSGDAVDLPGQTTLAATGQPGEPDHAGASLASGCTSATSPATTCLSSVWYAWSSPIAAHVTIDLCDVATAIDTTLAVYTGGAVDALSPVTANDDADPPCSGPGESAYASRVSFEAAPGTIYRIAVADYARQGPFALHLRASPVVGPGGPPAPGSAGPGPSPGGLGAATSSPAPDTIAPVVTTFGLTNNPFVVGARSTPTFGKAAAIRHRTGTTFVYTLSEAATVRVSISRRLAGRRKAGRCVAPTTSLRRAARCTRIIGKGTLTRVSHQGANRFGFSGRIGSRALPPGRYQARLTATDASRNTSRPRVILLTIARR